MNIDDIDFSKIRVVSTQESRHNEYKFPEEGWFVEATNNNIGPDEFAASYLYKPQWAAFGDGAWGGYTTKCASGELKFWQTFNLCRDSRIETTYLYECQDQETAKSLSILLNMIPSKSILHLDQGILDLKYKIETLQEKMKKLAELKKYAKFLIC